MRQIAVFALLAILMGPLPAVASDSCPQAVSIATARRLSPGMNVTVRGSVSVPTGIFTPGQSFAIQDQSGGIYVYSRGGIGQELALGDEVCVTGRLTSYHGMLEVSPPSGQGIARLGRGVLPVPKTVDPKQIGEGTEGLLVSVTGTVSELLERRFRVDDAVVYLDSSAGVEPSGLADGCRVTVIGLSADYDRPEVWPRTQTDILPGECRPIACAGYTIAEIQGSGAASPYEGQSGLSCITGCVTGLGGGGFYIQSTTPDADPRTSEGIFVYRWDGWTNPRGLSIGQLVEIHDFTVQEFYGSTEIVKLKSDAAYRSLGSCQVPVPIAVPVPADPQADPEALYEHFEGMRVMMDLDGTVVGPTTRYASLLPGGTAEIAIMDKDSSVLQEGRHVFSRDLPIGRGTIYLSGGLGQDLPDVHTGDTLSAKGLTGILAYSFGRYVLLVDPQASPISVKDAPTIADSEAPIKPDEFAICSFNLENLFDAVDDGDGDMGDWAPADEAGFTARLGKVATAIRENLRSCTVIGVQEVEGKDTVWQALANAVGSDFSYDYYESADERDIATGIVYDTRRATVRQSDQVQTCTADNYQVDYAAARGPRARPDPCTAGGHPLFDRPPYVADLQIRDALGAHSLDVRIVVNHFKSKLGDETINRPQRLAQARHVASLLTAPNSVALGDLNDSLGSPTLDELAGFVNLYQAHLPLADRYTYIYNGRAEVMDHFIMTAGLDRYFQSGGPVHINADFPDRRVPDATGRRSSDHDPVFVRFSFRPTGVSEALAGVITGIVASAHQR